MLLQCCSLPCSLCFISVTFSLSTCMITTGFPQVLSHYSVSHGKLGIFVIPYITCRNYRWRGPVRSSAPLPCWWKIYSTCLIALCAFFSSASGNGASTSFLGRLFHGPASPMVKMIFGLYFHLSVFILFITMYCTPLNYLCPLWLFVACTQESLLFSAIAICSFCPLSLISPCSHFIIVVGLL